MTSGMSTIKGDAPQALNTNWPTESKLGLAEAAGELRSRWRTMSAFGSIGLAAGIAAALLIPPSFTATTTMLPPQQQQSAASSALASLGSLATLAGGSGSLRTPGDQYVSLLQSKTIADRIVDRFKLLDVYDTARRTDARIELAQRVRVSLGKKDGIITIEVDDHQPTRSAEMANAYVDELRRLTAGLAVTEAQQRRIFFERHLKQASERMTLAQQALLSSGYNASVMKVEPKATADAYLRLRAEVTSQEAKLQALRSALTESAPEISNQQAILSTLRRQLLSSERESGPQSGDPSYVSRYREFKHQEALFELYSKQFELARVDESRDGALIQVIDTAQTPELKSKPRRGALVTGATAGMLAVGGVWVLSQALRRKRLGHKPTA